MLRVANIKHNPESACLGIGFSVVRKTFSLGLRSRSACDLRPRLDYHAALPHLEVPRIHISPIVTPLHMVLGQGTYQGQHDEFGDVEGVRQTGRGEDRKE